MSNVVDFKTKTKNGNRKKEKYPCFPYKSDESIKLYDNLSFTVNKDPSKVFFNDKGNGFSLIEDEYITDYFIDILNDGEQIGNCHLILVDEYQAEDNDEFIYNMDSRDGDTYTIAEYMSAYFKARYKGKKSNICKSGYENCCRIWRGYLEKIEVDSEHQGKGIAQCLLRNLNEIFYYGNNEFPCMSQLYALGAIISKTSENEGEKIAQHILEKEGYIKIGEDETCIYYMQKYSELK